VSPSGSFRMSSPTIKLNIKTLLLGRVDIWDNAWFPDQDPDGKPALRSGRRFKPLVRAKGTPVPTLSL
jgi:hypothetical protein